MAITSHLLTVVVRWYNSGKTQGDTAEEQVLSEQEYECFKPPPYEIRVSLRRLDVLEVS